MAYGIGTLGSVYYLGAFLKKARCKKLRNYLKKKKKLRIRNISNSSFAMYDILLYHKILYKCITLKHYNFYMFCSHLPACPNLNYFLSKHIGQK